VFLEQLIIIQLAMKLSAFVKPKDYLLIWIMFVGDGTMYL